MDDTPAKNSRYCWKKPLKNGLLVFLAKKRVLIFPLLYHEACGGFTANFCICEFTANFCISMQVNWPYADSYLLVLNWLANE